MTLSVIIPAYNNLADVLTCLNSVQALASRTMPIQFIVSDDCSPDVFYPNMIAPCAAQVFRNEVNKGFAGNCNQGAANAVGDILFFVNQDVEACQLSVSWDTALVAAFDNPQVGIVGARLLFPDGKLQSGGGEIDARLQPHHRCIGWSNLEHPEISTPQEVPWITGAALAIRADVFKQVGGFDEVYRAYFEDCDLCLRVRELGYKVWYEPRVTFIHKVGSTGGSPHFAASAQTFKQRWVDQHKIKSDTPAILEHWW